MCFHVPNMVLRQHTTVILHADSIIYATVMYKCQIYS